MSVFTGVPPYVNSSIPPVQTYLGVYFNHLVPEYTFLDDVYGNTRNLSLHLDRLLEDNTVADIDPEYWVQFNSDSQVSHICVNMAYILCKWKY